MYYIYIYIYLCNIFLICKCQSNSNESCQKWGVKCHFITMNSVLAPLNSVFAPMVGAKMGCHFNN